MGGSDVLGVFEQLVLLALLRLKDDSYGARIHDVLVERTGKDYALGQVYITLRRLEAKGLVTATEGDATEARGGRRKRYFQLTASGTTALQDAQSLMKRMSVGVAALADAR